MLGSEGLITLIVLVVVAVIIIIGFIYCCSCKPACENYRRRRMAENLHQDEETIENERTNYRTELAKTFETNENSRNEIRDKYQIKRKSNK